MSRDVDDSFNSVRLLHKAKLLVKQTGNRIKKGKVKIMATSKLKKKALSAQISNKKELMDLVKEILETNNYKVVDCRETGLEGATKFTLFARNGKADCKISFVSKPDKKSPYYSAVDEALGEELCDDKER